MVWVLFGSLAVALLMGIPVAISIGLSSLTYLLLKGFPPIAVISQRMVMGIDSFPLLALPLFMLAGNLMERGSTPRLMKLANALIGHITGGLAAVSVAASCFFGAVSGSGVATVAAVGSIVEPEMVRKGYGKGFAASLVAGAGGLGIVIPPSLTMVVYGVASGASIAAMFLGGFIPGLIAGLALIIYSIIVSKKRGYRGTERRATSKEIVEALRGAVAPLMMPVIVLGGVLSGVFTPTEAAVVSAVYALILAALVYKEIDWKDFIDILTKSALQSATIVLIVATAATFSWIMAYEHIPDAMTSALLSVTTNRIVILLLINLLMLVLGTFMETIAVVLIMTPIIVPVLQHFGIDLVHFGVALMLNLAIGGATPPLAVSLFTSTKILGISIEDTFPDILWVCAVMVAALVIILMAPDTVLLLPKLFMH